jgi:adenylate cyclase
VVKLMGDGALVKFASAVDAVECAVAIRAGMAEHEAAEPEDRGIAFRIRLNIGDIIVEDGDILGGGVNVAARLEGLAEPGASASPATSTTGSAMFLTRCSPIASNARSSLPFA